eukprot:GHUV01006256.1.p1 GENE.GHUV01006256.1~~GHUV01006256.1.p1  ORF type:complete len:533 (+),score=-103.85 GHUV01006256.1:477-2075(+)
MLTLILNSFSNVLKTLFQMFFCIENFDSPAPLSEAGAENQNLNDKNKTEILDPNIDPNIDEPILLYISKDRFVQFSTLKNLEEIIPIVRQNDHSLRPLPFKYEKLTFDLYNRMTQLVSFETFKANLEKYKVPGVYCVTSNSTNFIYIRETSNLLDRFKCLPNELKNSNKQYHTSQFVDDWNKLGSNNFVFQIIHMGSEWTNRRVRLERERQLVHENALNTYNNINLYLSIPYKNVVLPSLERVDEILVFPNLNDECFLQTERKNSSENYEQPGIYVIVCFNATGGLFYFGQTINLLKRFSTIRSKLINSEKYSLTFWNKALLEAKKTYGLDSFLFVPLYVGAEWEDAQKRKQMETNLIRLNSSKVLNVKKLNRNFQQEKNSINGEQKQVIEKPILTPNLEYSRISSPIIIKGTFYESINKAAIGEKTYPKFIRKCLKQKHPDYQLVNNQDILDMPSKFRNLPFVLYLVENRVYLTQAHVNIFEEGENYSETTLSERFKYGNIEGWSKISRREFCDRFEQENWELMWQWPNDQ